MAMLKSSEDGSESWNRRCRGLVRECKFQKPVFTLLLQGPRGPEGGQALAGPPPSGSSGSHAFALRASRQDLGGARRMMKPDGEKRREEEVQVGHQE